uniref:Uncharacterized protein n=1 Tax=Anopheles coluzzii TaxID=1518534 RepID=A0A8W7Q331_ANOCL
MDADEELLTTKPGRAHVYTNPSWHAVRKQSSRKMSAVSRSCAIFLHISGSNTGQSSKRGQAGVPISFIGSYDDTIRPHGAKPPAPIAPPPEPLPFTYLSILANRAQPVARGKPVLRLRQLIAARRRRRRWWWSAGLLPTTVRQTVTAGSTVMVMMVTLLLAVRHHLLVRQILLLLLERTVRGGVRVECDHGHPRPVALAARHHTLLVERKHRHQVVLAAHHHVLAVRAPAHAQKPTKVAARDADQLHVLVVEDAQKAVLRHHGQMLAARREAKLVDARVLVLAEAPLVQRNQTRTTFFFKSSFSAIAAIFSPEGLGWTAKNSAEHGV